MNLLLLATSELDEAAAGALWIRGRRAEHMRRVLKVAAGSQLRAGVTRGAVGEATVEEIDGDGIRIRFTPGGDGTARSRPPVDLLLALPRPKVLSRVLQHAAAFGVGRIDLTNAWRVDKSYLDSPRLEDDSLAGDLVLGCEQGGHTWVPDIDVHRRLMPLLNSLPSTPERLRLVAHPGAELGLGDVAAELRSRRALVAIGPEGGWIERELSTLDALGFRRVRLSQSILRTEVALSAALAQIELLRGG